MRKKAEEEKKKVISRLLAAEGLELDTDEDELQINLAKSWFVLSMGQSSNAPVIYISVHT